MEPRLPERRLAGTGVRVGGPSGNSELQTDSVPSDNVRGAQVHFGRFTAWKMKNK